MKFSLVSTVIVAFLSVLPISQATPPVMEPSYFSAPTEPWSALESRPATEFDPGTFEPKFFPYPKTYGSRISDIKDFSEQDANDKALQEIIKTKLPDVNCPLTDSATDQDLYSAVQNLNMTSGADTICTDTPQSAADIKAKVNALSNAVQYIYATLGKPVPPAINLGGGRSGGGGHASANSYARANDNGFTTPNLLISPPPPPAGGIQPTPTLLGTPTLPTVTSLGSVSNPEAYVAAIGAVFDNVHSLIDTVGANANSKNCLGKSDDSAANAVANFTQIASAIAPIALSAIPAIAGAATLLKPALGLTALFASANFLRATPNPLKPESDSDRRAILSNLCEFARVNQRRNLIYFAADGNVGPKYLQNQADNEKNLLDAGKVGLTDVLDERDHVVTILTTSRRNLESAIQQLHEDFQQLDSHPSDDDFTCEMGQNILLRPERSGQTYQNALNGFVTLLPLQENWTPIEYAINATEQKLRSSFQPTDVNLCARMTNHYLATIYKLARTGLNLNAKLQSSLRAFLENGHDDVRDYLKNEDAINASERARSDLVEIANQYKNPANVIDRVNIDKDMLGIGIKLLADDPGSLWHRTFYRPYKSPAAVWLKYIQTTVDQKSAQFLERYDYLVSVALELTPTGGRRAFLFLDPPAEAIFPPLTYKWLKTGQEFDSRNSLFKKKYAQALKDDEKADSLIDLTGDNLKKLDVPLSPLNPTMLETLRPQQYETHLEKACRAVQSSLTRLHELMDALRAEGLFCETLIRFRLLDTPDVSKSVRLTCSGPDPGDYKPQQLPSVLSKFNSLAKQRYWIRWLRLLNKFNELDCKRPVATAPSAAT